MARSSSMTTGDEFGGHLRIGGLNPLRRQLSDDLARNVVDKLPCEQHFLDIQSNSQTARALSIRSSAFRCLAAMILRNSSSMGLRPRNPSSVPCQKRMLILAELPAQAYFLAAIARQKVDQADVQILHQGAGLLDRRRAPPSGPRRWCRAARAKRKVAPCD